MIKVAGFVLGGAVLGIVAIGCSSSSSSSDPFGGTPNFGTIQQQFQHPTGTFTGKESQTFSAYASEQSNSSALSGFGSPAGGTTTGQSHLNLRLEGLGVHLEGGAPACTFTNETGSCNCPGGGTIQYDISGIKQYSDALQKGGTVDATIKYKASACSDGNGQSIDGTLFENYHGTVPAAGSQPSKTPSDFSIIVDAHLTAVSAARGTVKVDLDFEFATVNGVYSEAFSVQVNDGNVVVTGTWNSNTKTGTITVVDKDGTTTCTASDGKTAVCKGPDGTSRTVNL